LKSSTKIYECITINGKRTVTGRADLNFESVLRHKNLNTHDCFEYGPSKELGSKQHKQGERKGERGGGISYNCWRYTSEAACKLLNVV
jgi:hypothetical protein